MPAIPFYSSLDLNKNEIQNFLFHNLGSAPLLPGVGQVYFNTIDSEPYYWDGSQWQSFGKGTVTSISGSGGTTGLTFTGGPITTAGTLTLGGTLAISNGGTGAINATDARTNLGAASSATTLTFTTNNGLTGGSSAVDLSTNRAFTFGLTGQALALHNLGTNGIIVRTGSGTIASRSIVAGTGISVSNGDGVSGNPTVTLNATLAQLTDVIITTPSNTQILQYNGTNWVNATIATGGGTVTSVALSLPSIFTVTGSPVTSSGTLTGTLATQTANTVFAAPDGSTGVPSFRTLLANDIPSLPISSKITATAWRVFHSDAGGAINELALGAVGTYLRSSGAAAAPTFSTIAGTDVTGAALTKVDDTNVTLTLGGTPATSLLRAASITVGWAGTLSVARGGTGAGTLTGVVIGTGTTAMVAVAGTASQLLRRNAGNTAYEFFTHDFINQAGARTSISLTTTGTSGVATYTSGTGVLNIPNYTYTHPTFTAFTPTLTGANVLATFTTNTDGHVTALTTRTLTTTDIGAININQIGVANGVAPLDSGSKIPLAHIPDTVLGQVRYIGTYNATTNTPTLPNPTTVKGNYYVVSVGGTQSGANFDGGSLTFDVGDWVISNGTIWQKVDNTDAVVSVFGRIGAVTGQAGDYNGFYVRHDTAAQGLTGTQQTNARTNIQAELIITGAATTITQSNLTINRALVSDASGKVAISAVTSTELGYVSGVTSSIQTQINGKFNAPAGTTLQYLRGDGSLSTFPVLSSLAELNAGVDTNGRLINALVINQWFDAKIVKQNIGDGVATSFNIDHNFNTKDIGVILERISDSIIVYSSYQKTTLNRVVISFSVAPTTNQFRAIVIKY